MKEDGIWKERIRKQTWLTPEVRRRVLRQYRTSGEIPLWLVLALLTREEWRQLARYFERK